MIIIKGSIPDVAPIPAKLHRIEITNWRGLQYNPSVFVRDEALHVAVRMYDGTRVGAHVYNCIARVKDWKVESAQELRTPRTVEDLRMFTWGGRLWAFGAVQDGTTRQALIEIDQDGVTGLHVQQSPEREKNWMPVIEYVETEKLRIVYSVEPLVILELDRDSCRVVPSVGSFPRSLGKIRGGSQLVPYRDGWLAVVHEVYEPPRSATSANPLMNLLGI